MKTPSLAFLNSLGFITPAQKLLFAAAALKNALVSSPAVTITPASPLVPAKAEVLAQAAKLARLASPAVTATENTTGYLFGELYLNSPAYPAGTAIPAIPAKPASAEVVGMPAVVAVAAVSAVVSPAIASIKGWEEAIEIKMQGADVKVVVDLPYNTGMALIGASPLVNEITPSTLTIDKWLDEVASRTLETIVSEPPTLEQYFFKYAKSYLIERSVVGNIIKTNRLVNGVLTPVKRVTLTLAANSYNINLDSLQLSKIIKL